MNQNSASVSFDFTSTSTSLPRFESLAEVMAFEGDWKAVQIICERMQKGDHSLFHSLQAEKIRLGWVCPLPSGQMGFDGWEGVFAILGFVPVWAKPFIEQTLKFAQKEEVARRQEAAIYEMGTDPAGGFSEWEAISRSENPAAARAQRRNNAAKGLRQQVAEARRIIEVCKRMLANLK